MTPMPKCPSFGFVPCQKRRLAISRSDPIVETPLHVLYGNLLAVGDRLRLRTSEPDGRTAHFGPHCGEETNGESPLNCRRLVSALQEQAMSFSWMVTNFVFLFLKHPVDLNVSLDEGVQMWHSASLGRGLLKRVADTSPLIISDPRSPSSPVASVGQSAGQAAPGASR